MLTEIFKVKTAVQVLDPSTKIWEAATVLGDLSSDCVGVYTIRVKFTNWASKNKDGRIAVDTRLSRDHWPIRFPINRPLIREGTSRIKSFPMTGIHMLKENDHVYYVGRSFRDPTNIPSVSELQLEIENATELKMGWLKANDPFREQMELWIGVDEDGKSTKAEVEFIDYQQIRLSDWKHPNSIKEEVTESPPKPKKIKSEIPPIPQPPTNVSVKTTLSSFVEQLSGSTAKINLIVAPCVNGILRKGSAIVDNVGQLGVVNELSYVASKKKAVVTFTLEQDPDMEISIPINRVRLTAADFHRNEVLSIPDGIHKTTLAYCFFSSIKRGLALAVGKNGWFSQEVFVSHEFVKELMGFNKSKNAVSIFELLFH